jgi:hypothetical protein
MRKDPLRVASLVELVAYLVMVMVLPLGVVRVSSSFLVWVLWDNNYY